MNPLIVVVYWCLINTPVDDFDAHQLNASKIFMEHHPESCHTEQVVMLDIPNLTSETCKSQLIIRYMPQWQQKNTDKMYLSGDCINFHPNYVMSPLDLQALKDRIQP